MKTKEKFISEIAEDFAGTSIVFDESREIIITEEGIGVKCLASDIQQYKGGN